MIAITQATMKIFSTNQLMRMKLMAHNTRIVRNKLFATDQNLNINFFRALLKPCSCFMMDFTIHLLIISNFQTEKQFLIQTIREYFFIKHCIYMIFKFSFLTLWWDLFKHCYISFQFSSIQRLWKLWWLHRYGAQLLFGVFIFGAIW